MTLKYPVVVYLLDPSDEGFDRGARVRVDDADGDQFFFCQRPHADSFMDRHGMRQVDEQEMSRLRQGPKED